MTRYSVSFPQTKKFKDFSIEITDNKNGDVVFTRSGYCSRKSAKRGYARMKKVLLQGKNITEK